MTEQRQAHGGRTPFMGRRLTVLVLTLLITSVLSPQAEAIQASSASLMMTSDLGDGIGQGLSYSYSASGQDRFDSSGDGTRVGIRVTGVNGDWWDLSFAAPQGQQLVVGNYSGATRYPFQSPGEPGLDVSGNGRGCNTLTGSFEVVEAAFGANNYLERFHARFEQHCEGAGPALRGDVDIVNPSAPEPLTLGTSVDATGNVNRQTGAATLSGSATCSKPVNFWITGTLSQRAGRFKVASGSFYTQVSCSATSTSWTVPVTPSTGVPFNQGKAEVQVGATAFDEAYGRYITVNQTDSVRLVTK